MELIELIQEVHRLDEIARGLKKEKIRLIESIDDYFPYKRGEIMLCKGSNHTGKPVRVLRSRLFKTKFTWTAKVVVMRIGDDGYDLHPTDWGDGADLVLKKFVDILNMLDPPANEIEGSIQKDLDYQFNSGY